MSFSQNQGQSDRTEGFQPSDRLLRRAEFLSVSKSGKKLQDPYFILIYQTGRTDRPRLGVTVSKRVGKAVTRNRLKRLIREFFRKNRFALETNWDINIIAKPAAASLTARGVQDALAGLFSRIRRVRD
ncbi:MAG: ribonuclease P protein component [Desulfobacterales bacterium]